MIWRSPATFTKTFRVIWMKAFINHRFFSDQTCPYLPLVDLGLIQEGLWLVHLDHNVGWGDGLTDSEDAGIAFWQRTVSKPRWGGGQWATIPRVIGRRHGLAVKSRTWIDASWNEGHPLVTTQNGRRPIHMMSQMEDWAEWRIYKYENRNVSSSREWFNFYKHAVTVGCLCSSALQAKVQKKFIHVYIRL